MSYIPAGQQHTLQCRHPDARCIALITSYPNRTRPHPTPTSQPHALPHTHLPLLLPPQDLDTSEAPSQAYRDLYRSFLDSFKEEAPQPCLNIGRAMGWVHSGQRLRVVLGDDVSRTLRVLVEAAMKGWLRMKACNVSYAISVSAIDRSTAKQGGWRVLEGGGVVVVMCDGMCGVCVDCLEIDDTAKQCAAVLRLSQACLREDIQCIQTAVLPSSVQASIHGYPPHILQPLTLPPPLHPPQRPWPCVRMCSTTCAASWTISTPLPRSTFTRRTRAWCCSHAGLA